MADSKTLEDLAALKGDEAAPLAARKLDAQGRAYATGKRKNAVARVWIKPGVGKIVVNTKQFDQYFARPVRRCCSGNRCRRPTASTSST